MSALPNTVKFDITPASASPIGHTTHRLFNYLLGQDLHIIFIKEGMYTLDLDGNTLLSGSQLFGGFDADYLLKKGVLVKTGSFTVQSKNASSPVTIPNFIKETQESINKLVNDALINGQSQYNFSDIADAWMGLPSDKENKPQWTPPKCECGVHKTYGQDVPSDQHSTWCQLYFKGLR